MTWPTRAETIDRAVWCAAWKLSAFGLSAELMRLLHVWFDNNGPNDDGLRLIKSYFERPDWRTPMSRTWLNEHGRVG